MKPAMARILVVVLAGALLSTGCNVGRTAAEVGHAKKVFLFSQNLGPTRTQSVGDHMHDISINIDNDTRAFFDDLDILYMTDRPSRLSKWHGR